MTKFSEFFSFFLFTAIYKWLICYQYYLTCNKPSLHLHEMKITPRQSSFNFLFNINEHCYEIYLTEITNVILQFRGSLSINLLPPYKTPAVWNSWKNTVEMSCNELIAYLPFSSMEEIALRRLVAKFTKV